MNLSRNDRSNLVLGVLIAIVIFLSAISPAHCQATLSSWHDTINNITAKRSADGPVTIHLGGDENTLNYTPGWNYLFRMCRPRKEVLDGMWNAPEAQPAK